MFWKHRAPPASDCALIVAIPLDRDEFAADVDRQTDFLREYSAIARHYGEDPWAAYDKHAKRYRDIVDGVQQYGVAVTRRATLGMFVEAATRYRTVTLVAHARGPGIDARDVIDGAALMEQSHAIADRLSVSIAPPAGLPDPARVATWLDAVLGPEDVDTAVEIPETRAFAWRVAHYRERWDRRRVIAELCPGALTGGPAVEFHDGLKSIDEVSAVFPQHFHTLDLTVCDSVLLAERLRVGRSDGVILANPRPTTADFRLTLYRETIRLMTRWRTTYHDTNIQLRRQLRQQTWLQ